MTTPQRVTMAVSAETSLVDRLHAAIPDMKTHADAVREAVKRYLHLHEIGDGAQREVLMAYWRSCATDDGGAGR